MGLSIAQWMISGHNGRISIASVPDQTTTLTVRVPLLENYPA